MPPRSSGNDHKVQLYSGVDCVKSSLFGLDSPDGEYVIQQQDMGFARLCTDCNSLFGRNYVKPYVWLNKDVRSKAKSMRKEMPENGRGYVWLSLHEFMPLAFIKHVISNFCVIDSTDSMEDCREFLLDPESTALPGRYRLRMLIVPEPTKTCMSGWMALLLGKHGGGIDTIRLACLLVPPVRVRAIRSGTQQPATRSGRGHHVNGIDTIRPTSRYHHDPAGNVRTDRCHPNTMDAPDSIH